MGEQANAKAGVTASVASTGRREVIVLMSSAATIGVLASQPGVETVGLSGGPVPRAASQPSTTSERLRVIHAVSSLSGPRVLRNGWVLDFEATLRLAMKGTVTADEDVLSRRSLAQNLNAAMIGLVEALHCQMMYTCQMAN